MMSDKKDLDTLVEQTRQMTTHISNQAFLLKRGPEQLAQASRELEAKSSRLLTTGAKTKALVLLRNKGVDADSLERKLAHLELKTASAAEPAELIAETDLEGYLKQQHTRIIWSTIEETKTETADLGLKRYLSRMDSDWSRMMEVVHHSLKQEAWKENDLEASLRQGIESSSNLPYSFYAQRPGDGMNRKMTEFANVVCALNAKRFQNQPFALIHQFTQVSYNSREDRDTDRHARLHDTWDLLTKMFGEPAGAPDGSVISGRFLREQAFARRLIEDPGPLRKEWAQGAITMLGDQFFRHMREKLKSKPQSNLGGEPTIESTIKSYLSFLYPNEWPSNLILHSAAGRAGAFPVWAFFYFCMRINQPKVAYQFAVSIGHSEAITLFQLLQQENPHSSSSLNAIHSQFLRSQDPYCHLIYNIAGKFDHENTKLYRDIPNWSTQDWMWFKLNMISVFHGKPAPSQQKQLTLIEFQQEIRKYGSKLWDKEGGKSPLIYFQLLLMSQQFEFAIECGHNLQGYQVEVIHFALAMYYYGALNLHDASYLYSQGDNGNPARINYIQMLIHYSNLLANTDTIFAVHYLFTIQDRVRRNTCIQGLALSTRDFKRLFGQIGTDGQKEWGFLIQLMPENELNDLIAETAKGSDLSNNYQDALELFYFCGQTLDVVQILNKQLSRLMTAPAVEPERKFIIQIATNIYRAYRTQGEWDRHEEENELQVFGTQCQLVTFFDMFNQGKYVEALELMMGLELLPFEQSHFERQISSFASLDDTIKSNFSEIMLATMTCLWKLYEEQKPLLHLPPAMRTTNPEQIITKLRAWAKILLNFAGVNATQYQMPGETYGNLVRIEVGMA